jgi:hypothetical protein
MSDWYHNPFPDDDPKPNGQNGSPLQSRALFWPELARRPRAPYLIKGLIDLGTLVEVYGPSQSYKSFIMLDAGLHVAFGRSWCGRRVRQCGVLYVSAEGGGSITNRLDAWARHHEVDLAQVPFAVVTEPTNLLEEAGTNQLIADASRVPNLGLIIIDTAARVMPGGKEDTEAMSRLVAAADAIRLATGAAIIIIHHTGKEEGRGSRGSTVLPFASDTGLATSKDDATKIATLQHVRSRDSEGGDTFLFKLDVEDLYTDDEGDTVRAALAVHLDTAGRTSAKRKPLPRLTAKQKIALDALERAISANGKPAPAHNYIPSTATVVDLDLWRRHYLAATSNSDGQSEDTRRHA